MIKGTLTIAALALSALAMAAVPQGEEGEGALDHGAGKEAESVVTREEGLAAFRDIYGTTQHPRCLNCHPSGDAPLMGDESAPHSMAITRASPTVGLLCSTCHRDIGLKGIAHLPPADPSFALAPKEMAFQGRTLSQLCESFTTTTGSRERDVELLVEHLIEDTILRTSWLPGRSVPALTHPELVERFETWAAAGGPCPDDPEKEGGKEEGAGEP